MEKNFDIFKILHNNIAPEKGRVLIAEPFLPGRFFKRSIILLVEHSEEGSMGFVLNKPVEYKLNEVTKGFPKFDAKVFFGGPVDTNRLFFLHTLGEMLPESIHIKDELFWSGNFNFLCNMVEKKIVSPEEIRFFVGYSGWSAGQLESEIKQNSWLVSTLGDQMLMEEDNHDVWKKSMEMLGGKYKLWTQFPENPNLN